MKNSEYWKKRFEQLEQASHDKGIKYCHELNEQYEKVAIELDKEIRSWYQRLADNNGISLTEAKKMLNANELKEFKWTVDEYIKYGEQNALDKRWMKQLENASAKFHISRLEALKIQTQQAVEKLYGNQLDDINYLMRNVYTDNLYHAAFEIQKGFGVGSNFAKVDENKLSKILSKPWALDGKNFNERIWSNKQKLINELQTELTQMCVLGKSPDESIKRISQKLGVSYGRTKTLVMTEAAYFTSISDYDAFKKLGVERYEIVATLDSLTSEICQEMDGKTFDLKEFEIGVTAHPFHPNCRTVEVPSYDDIDDNGERAARGEDDKTYYVPKDMTYHQWENTILEGGNKDKLKPVENSGMMKVRKDEWIGLDFVNELSKASAIAKLQDTYGIQFKDSKKYPIEESIITDNVAWMDSFSAEYPDFMQKNPCHIPLIVNNPPSKMKNAVGYYSYYSSTKVEELALNAKYHSDKDFFNTYLTNAIKSKWTVENATTRSTFVHEFGHHVSNSMKHITKNSRWEHEFITECIKEFKEIEPDYTYETYVGMGDYVSRYATSSESELFAEAFSEYFGGKNPRKFAKLFGHKLEKILKGVK
ncbi:minor capsid protein [Longicatena caecimuris]|uniref:minor capsid protein n=1 Tax=Longicatena caecimuris TaxID=1796635 RepID=UPI003AB2253F